MLGRFIVDARAWTDAVAWRYATATPGCQSVSQSVMCSSVSAAAAALSNAYISCSWSRPQLTPSTTTWLHTHLLSFTLTNNNSCLYAVVCCRAAVLTRASTVRIYVLKNLNERRQNRVRTNGWKQTNIEWRMDWYKTKLTLEADYITAVLRARLLLNFVCYRQLIRGRGQVDWLGLRAGRRLAPDNSREMNWVKFCKQRLPSYNIVNTVPSLSSSSSSSSLLCKIWKLEIYEYEQYS